MGLLKKSILTYLICTGLVFNIALGCGLYLFGKNLSNFNSLPAALTSIASRIHYPVLQPVTNSIIKVSEYLDTRKYHWRTFDRSQWPMVGPTVNENSKVNHNSKNNIFVTDSKTLLHALKNVKPGQSIIIKDGTYALKGKRISVSSKKASKSLPISIKAENPGQVELQMDTLEGIYLNTPYWEIAGLRFIGKCSDDNKCEHAIHVVGKANNTSIVNNEFIDFNAAIKVNRYKNNYPDNGTISNNHFFSTHPRHTSRSVTPINIDHSNNWTVSRNIIRDFIKSKGNKVSYGAFMKGGVNGGIFENNLVICNSSKARYSGSEVGLSIGGGGMKNRRDNAAYEADNVTIRNNIIFHCSDVGIYVNRGKNTFINNNTLYNTTGIDVRFSESSARVVNNILSGKLRLRDNGSIITKSANIIYPRSYLTNDEKLDDIFVSPEIGNFELVAGSIDIHKNADRLPLNNDESDILSDFCGQKITQTTRYIGAYNKPEGCFAPIK